MISLPDTAEGRAIEQLVTSLSCERTSDKLKVHTADVLLRTASEVLGRIIGHEGAAERLAVLSADHHRRRGERHGRRRT